jgi:hypothetical protein
MNKRLLYFGCMGTPGHSLYEDQHTTVHPKYANIPGLNQRVLECIDSTFTPKDMKQGVYNVAVIHPVVILAWWDYTGDSRPGSNSALIGYGYATADEMLDDACKKFPVVMQRQERPVMLEGLKKYL